MLLKSEANCILLCLVLENLQEMLLTTSSTMPLVLKFCCLLTLGKFFFLKLWRGKRHGSCSILNAFFAFL